MTGQHSADAVVVGAGPNGLAAAIAIAREGHRVDVYEAQPTVGGGVRSAELTLPGFVHDVCSAIHPLAAGSSFLRELPLAEHGLEWVYPPASFAHPLDDGSAVVVERSIDATARTLGADGVAYRHLASRLVRNWDAILAQIMGPIGFPNHPIIFAEFGLGAIRSAAAFAKATFKTERARAMFAGCAAHSLLPLNRKTTAGVGLTLIGSAHAVGWPLAKGGSQKIVDALAAHLTELGGTVTTSSPISAMGQLAGSRAVLFDTGPEQMADIAGDDLPARYARRLRSVARGPGIFKVDFALDGPVPWTNEGCARAATVHVGGTLDEIASSEAAVGKGQVPEKPFVLLAQQSLFDATRAPEGKHTVWAYCHVPRGCEVDMTERIQDQISRFAPGFRDLVVAKNVMSPAAMQAHNANYVGGDISGGAMAGLQVFFRPVVRVDPYSTPNARLFICSSSTPPGPGVHGMCGYHAARSVLRKRL